MDGSSDDITARVDQYCAAWNEHNPEQRLRILSGAVNSHCSYCDPRADLEGIAALNEHIGAVLQLQPGEIRRTSPVQAHHDVAFFRWRRRLDDGRDLPEGIDVIEFDLERRILRIVGFFGPLP